MTAVTPHPKYRVLHWLQGMEPGTEFSVASFDDEAEQLGLTSKERAAAAKWWERYAVNTERTQTHRRRKSGRVSVWVLVRRPTQAEIEAAK